MKRIILYSVIVTVLLTFCGCNTGENFSPKVEQSITFDPNNMNLTSNIAAGNTAMLAPEKYPYYSDIMESIGKNGIIAAGYATGMRESFWHPQNTHTETQFVVTDVYRGTPPSSTIVIDESYALIEAQGERSITYVGHEKPFLKNDLRVLVYLEPLDNGHYYMAYHYIPLMPDYNEYSETYLQSVLGFFRGDKEEYIAESTWREEKTEYVNETYSYKYFQTYILNLWQEREISDEALLEEMEDHLLLRTATEYKIALWPYGHKNYTLNDEATVGFMRISIPIEEYFE